LLAENEQIEMEQYNEKNSLKRNISAKEYRGKEEVNSNNC